MQKLGALDANFLYSETTLMPNHIASVQRFELAEGVTTDQFIASLKTYLLARMHRVPYMGRKLKLVPGNFDHPFWVHDNQFDIDNHVVEVAVTAPGGLDQLERAIAQLHEIRMDRDRPLWNIYVLTGLEDGSVAFYNQVHHAAVDGMGGQAATMLLMDETPEHPLVEEPASVPPEAGDSDVLVMQKAMANLFQFQIGNAHRMMGGMESMRRMFQRAMDPARNFGAMAERAPKTRFNRSIDQQRSFAVGEFSLDEVRNMGRQLGCTVNDVFMTICSGALRRYLQRHDELPETGLIAGCPVSLRTAHDKNAGNRVTMMNVNLGTHIQDPRLRLLSIHQSAEIAKEVTADLAPGYDPDVSLPGLPAMISLAAASAEGARMADLAPNPVNIVISNVPGPKNTLFCNGARMLTHYPVSIPAHGAGLNITVQSYARHLYFGITACATALPDPEQLRDDMMEAYIELRQLLFPGNVAPIRPQAEVETEPKAAENAQPRELTRVA